MMGRMKEITPFDSFWLQSLAFKQYMDSLSLTSLFEVRDMTNVYNLALEYSLGDKIKNDFIDKIKFVNYLLETWCRKTSYCTSTTSR